MSLNRASSLATTPSLALSRLSSNSGSPAQASQLIRTSSIGSRSQHASRPTIPARHPALGTYTIRPLTMTSNSRFSEHGEYPDSPFVKRPSACPATPHKPNNSPASSSTQLTSSQTPRYTNSFGQVGVTVSHVGLWSTRQEGSFNQRLAFDKDLVTALLSPSSDSLKIATVAQGGRYDVDKWPNAEDVEGLALEVKWVNKDHDIEVLRSNGGEKVVAKKALVEKIVVPSNVAVNNTAATTSANAPANNAAPKQTVVEILEPWEDGAAMAVS